MALQVSSFSPDVRSKITEKLGESTLIYIARAKILTGFPNPLNWTEICEGYLVLYITTDSFVFLSIYDKESYEVTFKHELYINFTKYYRKLTPLLYYFPSDRCNIGIQFLITSEANDMEKQIQKAAPVKEKFTRLFKKKQNSDHIVVSMPESTEKGPCVHWDAECGYNVSGTIEDLPEEHQHFISQQGRNL